MQSLCLVVITYVVLKEIPNLDVNVPGLGPDAAVPDDAIWNLSDRFELKISCNLLTKSWGTQFTRLYYVRHGKYGVHFVCG